MKDQVEALVNRNVKAASLDSTLSADMAAWVKNEVLNGTCKILYVAPERCVRSCRETIPQSDSNATD